MIDQLDAMQASLRKLGGHGFPNWADDADKAITTLRAQLAETDALIAAAYEAAADAINKRGAEEQCNFGLGRETQNFYRARDLVRALTPSTARDAYSAAIAAAERAGYERGLAARETATDCQQRRLTAAQIYQKLAPTKADLPPCPFCGGEAFLAGACSNPRTGRAH